MRGVPGILLGLGLGGFIDGIVLHQLLQWHHLVSSTEGVPIDTVRGLERNTVADGLFHLATWVFVLVGTTLLVRAWQRGQRPPSWRSYGGLLCFGWGLFNVIEGTVDHQILGVHHVRDDLGGPLSWDLGFLALGLLLMLGGLALHRADRTRRYVDVRS